jgi:hypothetical protein
MRPEQVAAQMKIPDLVKNQATWTFQKWVLPPSFRCSRGLPRPLNTHVGAHDLPVIPGGVLFLFLCPNHTRFFFLSPLGRLCSPAFPTDILCCKGFISRPGLGTAPIWHLRASVRLWHTWVQFLGLFFPKDLKGSEIVTIPYFHICEVPLSFPGALHVQRRLSTSKGEL